MTPGLAPGPRDELEEFLPGSVSPSAAQLEAAAEALFALGGHGEVAVFLSQMTLESRAGRAMRRREVLRRAARMFCPGCSRSAAAERIAEEWKALEDGRHANPGTLRGHLKPLMADGFRRIGWRQIYEDLEP